MAYFIPIACGIAALALGLWKLWKLFKGPIYRPGDLRKKLESNKQKEDEHRCHVDTTGEGPRQVICLHGGPAIPPRQPWPLCQNKELQKQCTFYQPHQRGSGRSSRPFDEYPTPGKFYPGCVTLEETLGIAAQLSDIEWISHKKEGEDEKIVLIGHSFGGFLATLWAAEFPERVHSLLLLVPASVLALPCASRDLDLFAKLEGLLPKEGKEREGLQDFQKRYFDFGGLPNKREKDVARLQQEFGEWFMKATSSTPSSSVSLPPIEETSWIGGWATYASYLSMGMEHDYRPALRERLKNVSFKTIVCHAEKDVMGEGAAKEYSDLFPMDLVERHVLPDAGHFMLEDQVEHLEEMLRELLEA